LRVVPLRGNPAYLSNVARDVLAEVQQAHKDGRLGYLIGAGLSVPIGLPGWNAFNQALIEQTLERHTPGGVVSHELSKAYLDALQGQSLTAVEFVRRRAGSDFHVVVRGALYERKDLRKFEPTEVHYALAKLAVESSPPFPCLHTTNYDELLELALSAAAGRRAWPVHVGRRSWADGPRVVHLHGYFPFTPPPVAQKAKLARELILSDLDYSHLSNDHSAWTNRELLNLLDSRSVLIVGMSMTDPNVRRLLAYLSDRQRSDGPTHFVVLLHRMVPGENGVAGHAASMLDEDEHDFWKDHGVKILRIQTWDRLNYLLRRIRFSDDQWDRKHRDQRIEWAKSSYGDVDPDDADLQEVCTETLAHARDAIVERLRLPGRAEINLFLPLTRGGYRRMFSSVEGRARTAPRPFEPSHDKVTIPEVEEALIVGCTILRKDVRPMPPPAGQPPFQEWYGSLLSVPYFDASGGGIPMGVIQLVSSERDLRAVLDSDRLEQLTTDLRVLVREMCQLLAARR
jgi:SIR2-like domain